MIVTLNQAEIEQAIVNYVNSHAVSTKDKTIEIGLTAGRKGNGFSATVSIASEDIAGLHLPNQEYTDDHASDIEVEESEDTTESTNIFGAA